MPVANVLSNIKGNYWVYSNQKYIVLTGKELWILKKDLSVVCCRKDISNVYKVAFVNENQILTGQGKKASYRLINLHDGSDIRIWPAMKMESSMDRFALSSNKHLAYDCFSWKMKDYLVQIDLQTGELVSSTVPQGFRAICSIVCDENGIPCLLRTQYEESTCERISVNEVQMLSSNGITTEITPSRKYKWQHQNARIAKYFLGSSEIILTNDLFVYEPKTGRGYSLLENEPNWSPPVGRPSGCWLEEDRHLIFLMYAEMNVVIDWDARRVVSLYRGAFTKGCFVGNEYWIASADGIRRLPFPLLERVD